MIRAVLFALALAGAAHAERALVLATTTSTQDSGLLDALVPAFERETGVHVKTVAVGSGAALAMGARRDADVLLVHSPAAESRWMAENHGDLRLPVMHNEFSIVGPAADPASVARTRDTTAALAAIAKAGAAWVARDDGSGTDAMDRALWAAAGQPDRTSATIRTGQGMGATLMVADTRQAYTLTDRATWLAWRSKVKLVELVRGDTRLANPYHVITVHGAPASAARFARWITGPAARKLIAAFGVERHGEPLFIPDP